MQLERQTVRIIIPLVFTFKIYECNLVMCSLVYLKSSNNHLAIYEGVCHSNVLTFMKCAILKNEALGDLLKIFRFAL